MMVTKSLSLWFFLIMVAFVCSCSGVSSQQPEGKGNQGIEKTDLLTLERHKTGCEVNLAGNFAQQIEYFINYYGRVPASYEEWRDSGFLVWTLWSGNPTQPAPHLNHSLTAQTDPYGSFHYECLGETKYKLEFVHEIHDKRLVYSQERDISAPYSSVKPGLTYIEAKADSLYALLGLLDIVYYEWSNPPRPRTDKPEALVKIVDNYVSLVPEGFRVPQGVSTEGFFEFGYDLSSGKTYAVTDLSKSRFRLMIKGFGEPVELQRERSGQGRKLVLFSSDLLNQGFPGLFED